MELRELVVSAEPVLFWDQDSTSLDVTIRTSGEVR